MDGAHDLGGMHGFGRVVEPGADLPYHQAWEPRVHAVFRLIGLWDLGAGPSGRTTREEMPPAEYLAATYYERWLWSAERRLERAGTIAPGEVESMMARLAGGEAAPTGSDPEMAERAADAVRNRMRGLAAAERARFAVGDRVRVRRMRPQRHTRCPRYVRGAVGTVERVHGMDALPELSAYGEPATPEPVYAVSFDSRELWGADAQPPWTVLVDLWEHYLEAVELV